MQIYIITEGSENIVRCGFMSEYNAKQLLSLFPHLNLKIKVTEIIDFASEELLKELSK